MVLFQVLDVAQRSRQCYRRLLCAAEGSQQLISYPTNYQNEQSQSCLRFFGFLLLHSPPSWQTVVASGTIILLSLWAYIRPCNYNSLMKFIDSKTDALFTLYNIHCRPRHFVRLSPLNKYGCYYCTSLRELD